MTRKILTFIIVLALSVAGPADAFGPIGQPTAGLEQGKFEIGAEYSYISNEIEISTGGITSKTRDFKSEILLMQPGYGLTDDMEIYATLGISKNEASDISFGGDIAWGFGVKYTLAKDEKISAGIVFETCWKTGDASGKMDFTELTDWEYFEEEYDAELNVNEIIIAAGLTLEVTEELRLYGGPLFYYLDGDIDVDMEMWEETVTFDLEDESRAGGYFGLEWDISSTHCWYGEIRLIGDTWGIGTGISWKI